MLDFSVVQVPNPFETSGCLIAVVQTLGEVCHMLGRYFGSIQVSRDGPTLPSLMPKVWVGAGLGLGLRRPKGGETRPQKPGLILYFSGDQVLFVAPANT